MQEKTKIDEEYDIVFIEGNKDYLTPFRHNVLKNEILDLFKKYKVTYCSSDTIDFDHVPKAKVYIGFSQGTRYFKKMGDDSLKISIGGITGKNILFYKNKDDNARKGDHSKKSLESHFTLTDKTKNSIKKNTEKYLREH